MIWFHGTAEIDVVRSIMRQGFNAGTWFAAHLEDAIELGGNYIFYVDVDFGTRKWQVCSANILSPSRIIRCIYFQPTKISGQESEWDEIIRKRLVRSERRTRPGGRVQ